MSFVYVSQSKVGHDLGSNHMSHNTGSNMVAQLHPSKNTEVGHFGSADQTAFKWHFADGSIVACGSMLAVIIVC